MSVVANLVELLAVETDEFSLSVKGPRPSVGAFALRGFREFHASARREAETSNRVVENIVLRLDHNGISVAQPLLRVQCETSLYQANNVRVRVDENRVDANIEGESADEHCFLPLFFENVEYHVLLTSKQGRRFVLDADSPSLLSGLTTFEPSGTVTGTLNFNGNVGQATLHIVEDGGVSAPRRRLIGITFLVFSAKVDFLRDRLRMTDELNALHRALLLRLLRPTASTGATFSGKATGLEWLISLGQLADDVERTLRRIADRAHHQLNAVEEVRAVHKIKRPSRSLQRRIASQGKEVFLSRRSVPIEQRRVQVNTPENRYLKFLARRLVTTGHKWLGEARERYAKYPNFEHSTSDVKAQFDRIRGTLLRMERGLQSDFWQEVGEELPGLLNRTTFNFQDLFVRFEKLSKSINRALRLDGTGARLLSTISMEKLYELWTYCKLAEITAHLVTGQQDFNPLVERIKVDAFEVSLEVGKDSALLIGDEIILTAQRRFPAYESRGTSRYFSPLVPQEPDLVFEIRRRDTLHYLDAKYRIMAVTTPRTGGQSVILNSAGLVALDLQEANVRISPREDDINVMHRYRDAVRVLIDEDGDEEIQTRPAAGYGVIIYPHRPAPNELNAVLRSLRRLQQFKIGAVPLCPGIEDVDWQTSLSSNEVVPPPIGTEQVRVLAHVIAAILADQSAIQN